MNHDPVNLVLCLSNPMISRAAPGSMANSLFLWGSRRRPRWAMLEELTHINDYSYCSTGWCSADGMGAFHFIKYWHFPGIPKIRQPLVASAHEDWTFCFLGRQGCQRPDMYKGPLRDLQGSSPSQASDGLIQLCLGSLLSEVITVFRRKI